MGMPVIEPSGIDRCQAITDIIQSVALEQAALGHILNAEGKKIEKIVRISRSPRVMLYANKSVEDMIKSITKLEMLLQYKLELFEKCLCDPCEPCDIVTDVDIEEEEEDPYISVTKVSMQWFRIRNTGSSEDYSNFVVTPTPDVPIALQSAPTGVTLMDNILTIDWTETAFGRIILTVGEGDCAINVRIRYRCNSCEPCETVTDVDIEEEEENPNINVTKNNMVNFSISNTGYEGTSYFIVIPTPGVPIALQSAPTGVSLIDDVLIIDWTETTSGMIELTIGEGDCAINVRIRYRSRD